MSNYKKDAEVYGVDVLITNVIRFNIKSNDPEFARLWLQKQLAPILTQQSTDAKMEVEIQRIAQDEEEYAAEVYGKADWVGGEYVGYEVFEHVKNELFGETDANGGD